MNRLRMFAAAGVLGSSALLSTAPPARGECVYGLAYVERENAPTIWLLGPDPCVYPTGWNQVVFAGPVDVGHDMPEGAPNRVYVEARVPVP